MTAAGAGPREARLVALLKERFTGRSDAYLDEKRKCVREDLTDDVLLAHLRGQKRIGVYANADQASSLTLDFDGKNLLGGRDEAWRQLHKVATVVDADLGLPPVAAELSRSHVGYHAWIWFALGVILDDALRFARLLLKAAGLPDDGDESKEGHPGIFPHPPGNEGIGGTSFLPWSGLLNGARSGLFVDLSTGEPLDRQETALEDVVPVSAERLRAAISQLEDMAADSPARESQAAGARRDPEEPKPNSRHGRLRDKLWRLAREDEDGRALIMEGRESEIRRLIDGAIPKGVDLSGVVAPLSTVAATHAEFDAEVLVRRRGLHLWYAAPGTFKTYVALLLAMQMTQLDLGQPLLGVEEFVVRRRWRCVLWLGDEESAGELRARAEIIARGHGLRPPEGNEILFADASGGHVMLDVRHVPQLVELTDADAVFIDPLANLTPATDDKGNPVKVDLDNTHALRTVCRPLRRLAKQRDISVFLLHHPNATGERERGPTAYRGSADLVLHLAFTSHGAALCLDVQKNRDGRRPRVFLEPVWSGHRASADRPLSLHFERMEPPTNEDKLTPTATKILAAIRAAGPLSRNDAYDAAPKVHRTTRDRNLSVLVKRKLVEQQADGRYIAVDPALPGCAEACTE